MFVKRKGVGPVGRVGRGSVVGVALSFREIWQADGREGAQFDAPIAGEGRRGRVEHWNGGERGQP